MARNKTAVKKFMVTLSDEERGALTALIHTGKHPAQKLLKARILLKAEEKVPLRPGAPRRPSRDGKQGFEVWRSNSKAQGVGLGQLQIAGLADELKVIAISLRTPLVGLNFGRLKLNCPALLGGPKLLRFSL